ncbi:MAG: SPOR domain-containing protein [Candidatus Wallbacteria bacterium]
MKNVLLKIAIAFMVTLINFAPAFADVNDTNNSPDKWSNGITDSALQSLPDADNPYVLECGPFKNRDAAKPVIYKLASEAGMPGYLHFLRGANVSPKDNTIMVRVGTFATLEEAQAKLKTIKGKYLNLSAVKAYEATDEIADVVLLDAIYEEFDQGSNFVGRFLISCTPQVPESVQRFVKISDDKKEISFPINLSRISSNANEALKRIKYRESQLLKEATIAFDEQFNCYMITIKTKKPVELSHVKQYAPVLVIDLEKCN